MALKGDIEVVMAQVDTAALRLRDSILTSAETEGLTYQAYWLSTTLALGAFLKVCLPQCSVQSCGCHCAQEEPVGRIA
jgi:hypothetical protein